MGDLHKIDVAEKFRSFHDHWHPRVAAELNGQEVKLTKLKGEFIWHQHEREDELFFVWRGQLRIEFRDRVVELSPGEFMVAPRGVEHRPVADEEVEVILFEPAETRNTGNVFDEKRTRTGSDRI